jgi:hypothetical protein
VLKMSYSSTTPSHKSNPGLLYSEDKTPLLRPQDH